MSRTTVATAHTLNAHYYSNLRSAYPVLLERSWRRALPAAYITLSPYLPRFIVLSGPSVNIMTVTKSGATGKKTHKKTGIPLDGEPQSP